MDFLILNSEMSQYRDKYLGYLIINFSERREEVEEYLNSKDIIWRYYE